MNAYRIFLCFPCFPHFWRYCTCFFAFPAFLTSCVSSFLLHPSFPLVFVFTPSFLHFFIFPFLHSLILAFRPPSLFSVLHPLNSALSSFPFCRCRDHRNVHCYKCGKCYFAGAKDREGQGRIGKGEEKEGQGRPGQGGSERKKTENKGKKAYGPSVRPAIFILLFSSIPS